MVFGRGLGTFIPEKYFILDNQYIASTLEAGLVGLSALFLVMLVSFGCARGARRLFKDPVSRDLAQSLAAAAAVPVVVFATFDALSFPMVPGLMFLLLGVNGALWRLARPAWRPTIAAAPSPERPLPERAPAEHSPADRPGPGRPPPSPTGRL